MATDRDNFESVIGLEVHCQLKTASKLFCACPTTFGAVPNANTCPVCLGLPGVLPVLNEKAVDFAIMAALAVSADIAPVSIFARKQYFYPDLPKGYQISQFDRPYCQGGFIPLPDGRRIPLVRIHMEEDAGKNVHDRNRSLVDLNRAGIPLLEIVSQPELRSAKDASDYLKYLWSLVRHLGISDGNMEEGSFRCDANVSIRPRGQRELGTRCEIKNLNSFRNIERAIEYEIDRQIELVVSGGKVTQETRLYDVDSGRTCTMRSKEESHDYRYFPDPDLMPLVISASQIDGARARIPELPEAMTARFISQYGVTQDDAVFLVADVGLAAWFERVVAEAGSRVQARTISNWIMTELVRELHSRSWSVSDLPFSASMFARLFVMIAEDRISGKIGKIVFSKMVETGLDPEAIVRESGLEQVSDRTAVVELVKKVVDENPAQVQQFIAGKDKILGFFVGQIMKLSGGKMNPGLVNELLLQELNARKTPGR